LKAKTSVSLSSLTGFLFAVLITGGYCIDAIAIPARILDENVSIPLSLEEAVLLGIRNNRGVQTAYLQRISQKFDLYVSEGKFFPKLTIASAYTNNIADGIKTKTKGLTTTATMSLPTGVGGIL